MIIKKKFINKRILVVLEKEKCNFYSFIVRTYKQTKDMAGNLAYTNCTSGTSFKTLSQAKEFYNFIKGASNE